MQSFSFKSDYDENRNIERIITERNRKLAKQQLVFTLLLMVLLAILAWYVARRFIYTEFDGYVQTEYKDYRAMEDLYLFDQYTDVGDVVIPGDTLYSFVYVNLFDLGNMSSEPNVVVNDRNARLQLNMAYAEANVQRVRIRELENQIAKEDNNIRFGLTDNSHKMDLQRQLAETREQLNATLKKAYMYGNIRHESQAAVNRFGQYSVDFAGEQLGLDHSLRQLYDRNSPAIRYAIAQDTAIVTKRWAPPFSRVFKQEDILQLEDVNYENSNMQVVAYVPTHQMGRVNNNTRAEVKVNDDVKFTATVKLLGARTEELPEQLRNSLSHTYVTVMVVFRPDPGQTLPLWAVVDRVPVKVRIRNFGNGRRDDGSDYWFITRYGLTEMSKYYLGMMRRQPKSPFRYNPDTDESLHASAPYDKAKADTVRQDTVVVEQRPHKSWLRMAAEADMRHERHEQHQQTAESDAPRQVQQSARPHGTITAPQPAPQPKEQPAPQPKEQPKERQSAEAAYVSHRVEYGETLYGIARRYGVSVESITALNPGIEKILYAETTIKIPVGKTQNGK